jgi:hypothetical protein
LSFPGKKSLKKDWKKNEITGLGIAVPLTVEKKT